MNFNLEKSSQPQPLEKNKLTPISGNVPDDIFVEEVSGFLKKEIKSLQNPEALEVGKTALPILVRDTSGENISIVNNIKISKIMGMEDRYQMGVLTSGFGDINRLSNSIINFDVTSKNLNESYPAREKHWIMGTKNGEKQLIGIYKDFMDKGDIEKFLAEQGYSNFSEAWIADFDRHIGSLNEGDSQQKELAA